MQYALIIGGAEGSVWVDTRGELGDRPLGWFDSLDEAREAAHEVAHDHYYGVEIVDVTTWEYVAD